MSLIFKFEGIKQKLRPWLTLQREKSKSVAVNLRKNNMQGHIHL